MKINRVFIPLSKEPYEWFKCGFKKWELRRYGRQYTEKHIKTGKIVELRCGYSNASNAIWGTIKEVIICSSLNQVFEQINYSELIPIALDRKDAIEKSSKILNLASHKESQFIVFKITKLDSPEFISLSDEYFDLIRDGNKKSTIRFGKRFYKEGPCILYSENQSELVRITQVEYIRFNNLTYKNALNDGFSSLDDLVQSLRKFYTDLKNDDEMTVVYFSYGSDN